MQRKTIWLFAVIALAAFVACGDGGKAAADAAMQALQTAYGTVKSDAAAYVPDQAKSIDEAIAAAQETLSKGDYMKALGDVQGLTSKVGELGAAVATKQAELTKAWEGLGAGLPGVVQSIQGRVEELSKARRLPPGVKKEAVEAAKSGAAHVGRGGHGLQVCEPDGGAGQGADRQGEGRRAPDLARAARARSPEVAIQRSEACQPRTPRIWSPKTRASVDFAIVGACVSTQCHLVGRRSSS